MADLISENNNLRKIVEAKDKQILNLQLQLLQLTTANSEVANEQAKSDEVLTGSSKSGK